MDSSYEVTDSSDWLNTSVAPLRSVEAALRCQVCKDFYNTPMLTTCCHTFCSLCIRRCLTGDGKCPTCRSSDQEIRLRRNWAVQELVDAFTAARPSILKLGQDILTARTHGKGERQKRKRADNDVEGQDREDVLQRTTRSKSHKSPKAQSGVKGAGEEESNTDDPLEATFDPEDGLSACPICSRRMKIEDVFPHLDTHQEGHSNNQSKKIAPSFGSVCKIRSPSKTSPPPIERLPSLSYSIMNENALRKKIGTLGIPNWGSKQLLIRRHTEWVNLWNANCDSSKSRTKRELLHDLDVWERTQGGSAPVASNSSSSTNTVMSKDFDGSAWSASHGDDFRQLIAQARQKPAGNTVGATRHDLGSGRNPSDSIPILTTTSDNLGSPPDSLEDHQ
ncbi:E3 ubiquitin-protein ligase rad18 [Xylographa soralifera]|nr:E3 ubiquitin-protein ligase rad18 [Xylographa soralifera]